MSWRLENETGWLRIKPSDDAVATAQALNVERGFGNTIDPEAAWQGYLCEAAFKHFLVTQHVDLAYDGEKNDDPDFVINGVAVEFKARGVFSRAALVRENMADCLVETDAKTKAAVYAFGFYLKDRGEVLLAGAVDVRAFRAKARKRTESSRGTPLRRPHLTVPLGELFSATVMRNLAPPAQAQLAGMPTECQPQR